MIKSFNSYPSSSWIKDWELSTLNNYNKLLLDHFKLDKYDQNQQFKFNIKTGLEVGTFLISTENSLSKINININNDDKIIFLHNGIIIYGKNLTLNLFLIQPNLIAINKKNETNSNNFKLFNKECLNKNIIFYESDDNNLEKIYFITTNTNQKLLNSITKDSSLHLPFFDKIVNHELNKRSEESLFLSKIFNHHLLFHLNSENLLKGLRNPTHNIPGLWSVTKNTEELEISEFLIIIQSWSILNINIAIDLINTIFLLQSSSGAIPASVNNAGIKFNSSPKPILSKTCEIIFLNSNREKLDNFPVSKLKKYILWIIKYFNPQGKNIHKWNHESESLIKNNFNRDYATVDLTSLLIVEIKSYLSIAQKLSFKTNNEEIESELEKLIYNLNNLFWNNDIQSYSNAVSREDYLTIKGYISCIPLITNEYTQAAKQSILEKLNTTYYFSDNKSTVHLGMNLDEWRKVDLSDIEYPVIEKVLFFQSLLTADPHGALLYDYIKLSMTGLNDWQQNILNKKEYRNIPIINSAYVIFINKLYLDRYKIKNKYLDSVITKLKKLNIDRVDLSIVIVAFLTFFGVVYWNKIAATPPPLDTLKAEINNAYVNYNINEVKNSYKIIEKYYPLNNEDIKLLITNIALLENDYNLSEKLIKEIREKYPDSPGPMIINAIILHKQNRFDEADKIYYEFIFLFNDIFPEVSKDVEIFYFLLKEKLDLPQNWRNIYKYKMLHEI